MFPHTHLPFPRIKSPCKGFCIVAGPTARRATWLHPHTSRLVQRHNRWFGSTTYLERLDLHTKLTKAYQDQTDAYFKLRMHYLKEIGK